MSTKFYKYSEVMIKKRKKRSSSRNLRKSGVHEYLAVDQCFGVSDPELHSGGMEPVTFFAAQSLFGEHVYCLEGHISRLEGTNSDLGGARPRNASLWSLAW